ncbi:LysM peptidoglycan-binding domain-containing protein [Lactobacillus gigeriorum]|uniref:LysM domain-containing protein n=1 Tax=Lactobacillus gigeriorum DSM 23908 = CRBIP 24.85 TaxID=1423751 RepID=I7K270_9LACO|nr:LysM peptidoglycan-binding domain-containing protein [Lactobacillus gigeriorum]CCI87875.1 Putative uncharacterized protein [Lactobacillus gigeriorum DSM 23908 = CRBIP 24.85]
MNKKNKKKFRSRYLAAGLVVPLLAASLAEAGTSQNVQAAKVSRTSKVRRYNLVADVRKRIDYKHHKFVFKKGDTIWAVAKALNIRYQLLMKWNGIKPGEERHIPVGTVIYFKGNDIKIVNPKGKVVAKHKVKSKDKINPKKPVAPVEVVPETNYGKGETTDNNTPVVTPGTSQTNDNQTSNPVIDDNVNPSGNEQGQGNSTNTTPSQETPGTSEGKTDQGSKDQSGSGEATTPGKDEGTIDPSKETPGTSEGKTDQGSKDQSGSGEATTPGKDEGTTEPSKETPGTSEGNTDEGSKDQSGSGETTPGKNESTTDPSKETPGTSEGSKDEGSKDQSSSSETTPGTSEGKTDQGSKDQSGSGETTKPSEPVNTIALSNEVASSSAVTNQVSYQNAGDASKTAFDQALSDAKSVLNKKDAKQSEVDQALSKLKDAKSGLDGKQTDISALKAAVDDSTATKETDLYKNASGDKKSAYDTALTQAQNGLNNPLLSQADADKLAKALTDAKASLDGKTLTNKDKLLAELQDLVNASNAIMNTSTDPSAKQVLGAQTRSGQQTLDNSNAANETGIKSQIAMLKYWVEFYKTRSTELANSKKLYDDVLAEAKAILNSGTLPDHDSVSRTQQLVDQMEKVRPSDPNSVQYIVYAPEFKDNLDLVKKENAEAIKEYQAEAQARIDAKNELDRLQVPGSPTYVQLADENGNRTSTLDQIVDRAKLVSQMIPTNPDDKVYDNFKSVEDYLQVGTPEYTKMQNALDSIKARIRAQLDAGKGNLFGKDSELIDTVPTDEEVEALKPLIELSDAYTNRAREDMNLMRHAIGLKDYETPEVSDRRKAMMVVHALAEYEAGLIPKYQAYTHLGTVASKLIPTAIIKGTNENYFPSYNVPTVAKRLTPEYLADIFVNLDLQEGIRYYKDLFTDTKGLSGHFTNVIDFENQYMTAAAIIGNIKEAEYGYKKYYVSMTDFFWELADDKYKQILKYFDEWPAIDPAQDLNKTQAEIDQLINSK